MVSENELIAIFTLGFFGAASCLLPFHIAIFVDFGITLLVVFIYLLYLHWESAEPNQWMLLLDNGKLVKAGIGLRCLRFPYQQIIKFPSKIQQVEFTANNITLEKSGLELTGFAIWSVNKEGQGPYQFYKYSQGANPDSTVRTTCESILRTEIANNKLMDLMQNRIEVRNKMIVDLQKQLSGWGIQIECVVLTQVKICSGSVFKDLQAEFRQKAHLLAEKIRLKIEQDLKKVELENGLKMCEKRSQTDIEKDAFISKINIDKEKAQAEYFKEQNQLEQQKKDLQHKVELTKLSCNNEVNNLKTQDKLILSDNTSQFQLLNAQKQLNLDKNYDKKSISKYYFDQVIKTYDKIPLQEIFINQYQQKGESNPIFSALPGINEIYLHNKKALSFK